MENVEVSEAIKNLNNKEALPQGSPNLPGSTNTDSIGAIPFGVLERKHPEYDAEYWAQCQALYEGGRKLLGNDRLMSQLFPSHMQEAPAIYKERKRRAFYIPYAAQIIDYIISGLMTCPAECAAANDAELDEYYEKFFADVSPAGGRRQSLNQLLREQMHSALLYRVAWTQIDFPIRGEAATLAEQESIGALDAYALQISPEAVYDWEVDDSGELLWVLVCRDSVKRASILNERDTTERTYTFYTARGWSRYAIAFKTERPPSEKTEVALLDEGEHSFGRVPFVRLELPPGLWAMNKLECLAREHFNKRCSLAWAEYKTLFQQLYEFTAPPDPMLMGPVIASDEGRAVNQVRGIGYTQTRYAGDRAEYIGPDSSPFQVALESTKDLRDEMHRVTYQMALTFENSASALRRSGESKREDRGSHGVVLKGLGQYMQEHALEICKLISAGRGDSVEWVVSGLDKFDEASLSDMIGEAEALENVPIPSPTFQRRHKYMLAKMKLGDEASEEDLENIDKELEVAFATDEPYRQSSDVATGVIESEDSMVDEDTKPHGSKGSPSVIVK